MNTATDSLEQMTDYYPYGLPFAGSTNPTANRYKYGAKELATDLGLNAYDFEARMQSPALPMFAQIDPMAEKYYSLSPYAYCAGNPINLIDPSGMTVNIIGSKTETVVEDLQKSCAEELTLSVNELGELTYTIVDPAKELSSNSQRIINAIDDTKITINLNNVDGFLTSEGDVMCGGAFMGNTIVSHDGDPSVTAHQDINIDVLIKLSEANGAPGAGTLHELTEAYEGAVISMNNGYPSLRYGKSGSVYDQAHARATKEPGSYILVFFDKNGVKVEGNPRNCPNLGYAEYITYPKGKNKVIIQTINIEDLFK